MEPRRLRLILEMSKARRVALVAEGIALLGEHVHTLGQDLRQLLELGRGRGAAIVDSVTSEQAAGVMMLLDAARAGWSDQAVNVLVRNFYSHLARGLYREIYGGKPASLREIRDYADGLRQSRYLDGPNDVDWIFRNSVLGERENLFYVDYVEAEEERFWSSPAEHDEFPLRDPAKIVRVVETLRKLGALTVAGMQIVTEAWAKVAMDDNTHWGVVRTLNDTVVLGLYEAGLPTDEISGKELAVALDSWMFPLTSIDLTQIKVTDDELNAKRARWGTHQEGW